MIDNLKLLRGRVAVAEDKKLSEFLWTPDENERKRRTHKGTVLAIGLPPRTKKGTEVPPDFKVGDTVWFVWSANESLRSFPGVAFLTQEEIIAVEE